MKWVLIVIVLWLVLAGLVGLVIGRGICMADREGADEVDDEPNFCVPDVDDAVSDAPAPPEGAGSAGAGSPRT